MVGTKWAGSPAVGTGAVAQSIDGGQSFRDSATAYVPLTLTAVACPSAAGCVAVGGDTVARLALLQPKRHRTTAPSPGGSAGSAPHQVETPRVTRKPGDDNRRIPSQKGCTPVDSEVPDEQ